jgi:hypothetical protein
MPPLNDASVGETNTGDAALGAKVNPEQTTVTLPAGTSALTAILMIPVGGVAVIPVLSVTDAVDGLGTSSQLDEEATAVIKAVGNVTVIVPLAVTVKGVDVVNDNVAVWELPEAVDNAAVGLETMLEQDAVSGDDAALNPWFVILTVLNAFATPDKGVKV